jgi:hypothetical protein
LVQEAAPVCQEEQHGRRQTAGRARIGAAELAGAVLHGLELLGRELSHGRPPVACTQCRAGGRR